MSNKESVLKIISFAVDTAESVFSSAPVVYELALLLTDTLMKLLENLDDALDLLQVEHTELACNLLQVLDLVFGQVHDCYDELGHQFDTLWVDLLNLSLPGESVELPYCFS